mgnify:CR=1 FL=1
MELDDTSMAWWKGRKKLEFSLLGRNHDIAANNVICNISEPSLIEAAKKENKTRAQMSMRIAKEDMNGGIVVIGNAPTALLEVMEMIREGITKPALVIGIPVGFVSAVESKDELSRMDIPFITNQGRKGGSPCASAIVNALYKLLRQGN